MFDKLNIVRNKISEIKKHWSQSLDNFLVKTKLNYVLDNIKKNSMYYILLILFVVFAIITKGDFLNPLQIINLIQANAYIWILSLGMLLIIIAGHIDLGAGKLTVFLGVVAANLYSQFNQNIAATVIVVLIIGFLIGLIQGLLVGYGKIPAFVVTLGAYLVFKGASTHLSGGSSPTFLIDDSIVALTYSSFPDVNLGTESDPFYIIAFLLFLISAFVITGLRFYGRKKRAMYGLKNQNIFVFIFTQIITFALTLAIGLWIAFSLKGLQLYILYTLIIIVFFAFLTQFTTFGRSIYAIGGNKKAAELSGINIKKNTTILFIIMGVLSAIAAFVMLGVTFSVSAANGEEYALNAISSVFIGGASVSGGIGNVSGTIAGALILQSIDQAFTINNIPAPIQQVIKGLILVGAVSWDVFSNRKTR